MAPRTHTLPAAATASARAARAAFHCTLCGKGYARMNEFEAHENSYDHQHRKRLLEMRQLTRDPNAAARQREAEQKSAGLTTVSSTAGGGTAAPAKKAPVFKSTLQAKNVAVVGAAKAATTAAAGEAEVAEYDPERPTEYRDFELLKVPKTGALGPGEWEDSEDEDGPRWKMVMY